MFKKNSNKKTKKFAFSLIELSIVILVIGILMVGVSQGYNIVRSAQISNARSITAKSPIQQMSGLLAWYETSWKESLIQSELKERAANTGRPGLRTATVTQGYEWLIENGYASKDVGKDGKTQTLTQLMHYKAEYGDKHADDVEVSPF
jgi:prepilin-type N-terminal cleavage/methylation domain-containing protein